jgi:hypothetical protein
MALRIGLRAMGSRHMGRRPFRLDTRTIGQFAWAREQTVRISCTFEQRFRMAGHT